MAVSSMGKNDSIMILGLFGLGYLLSKINEPAVQAIIKKAEDVWSHTTGTAHQEQGITRVMGGPQGFKGTSPTWPRFFPAINEWWKL